MYTITHTDVLIVVCAHAHSYAHFYYSPAKARPSTGAAVSTVRARAGLSERLRMRASREERSHWSMETQTEVPHGGSGISVY